MNIFQLPLTRFWVAKKVKLASTFFSIFLTKRAQQHNESEVRRGEVELSCPAAHDEIEQCIQIRTWQEIRAQIARAITRVDFQIAN